MDQIITRLDEITNYILPLLPLANCHLVNFITQKLWDSFAPLEIKKEFEDGDLEEILNVFWGKPNDSSDYPSIQKFLKETSEMSISLDDGISMSTEDFKKKIEQWSDTCHYTLHYEEFMSLKKSHEVEMMSFLVATLASFTRATHCVDIGGGKGYLSSILALEYKLKVLGLDSCNIKTLGAANRASKLKKYWQGTRKKINVPMNKGEVEDCGITKGEVAYKQETEHVSSGTDLIEVTRRAFPGDGEPRLGVVGLHTCGDLAPVCLRQFVANEESMEYLVNVGCCHHLLTEGLEPGDGFPLSHHLQSRQFVLGRNARMLSLLAHSRMYSNKKVPIEPLLYRAVFQELLIDKLGCDNIPKGQVGRIADKCKNFAEYVQKALVKLHLRDIIISDEEAYDFFGKHECWKPQLLVFFMLRVSLAPVLENIILLDRLLYLKEQGIQHSYLVKMFDPVLSPRCYGVVALRDRNAILPV